MDAFGTAAFGSEKDGVNDDLRKPAQLVVKGLGWTVFRWKANGWVSEVIESSQGFFIIYGTKLLHLDTWTKLLHLDFYTWRRVFDLR